MAERSKALYQYEILGFIGLSKLVLDPVQSGWFESSLSALQTPNINIESTIDKKNGVYNTYAARL